MASVSRRSLSPMLFDEFSFSPRVRDELFTIRDYDLLLFFYLVPNIRDCLAPKRTKYLSDNSFWKYSRSKLYETATITNCISFLYR